MHTYVANQKHLTLDQTSESTHNLQHLFESTPVAGLFINLCLYTVTVSPELYKWKRLTGMSVRGGKKMADRPGLAGSDSFPPPLSHSIFVFRLVLAVSFSKTFSFLSPWKNPVTSPVVYKLFSAATLQRTCCTSNTLL